MAITQLYMNEDGETKAVDKLYCNIDGKSVLAWEAEPKFDGTLFANGEFGVPCQYDFFKRYGPDTAISPSQYQECFWGWYTTSKIDLTGYSSAVFTRGTRQSDGVTWGMFNCMIVADDTDFTVNRTVFAANNSPAALVDIDDYTFNISSVSGEKYVLFGHSSYTGGSAAITDFNESVGSDLFLRYKNTSTVDYVHNGRLHSLILS